MRFNPRTGSTAPILSGIPSESHRSRSQRDERNKRGIYRLVSRYYGQARETCRDAARIVWSNSAASLVILDTL